MMRRMLGNGSYAGREFRVYAPDEVALNAWITDYQRNGWVIRSVRELRPLDLNRPVARQIAAVIRGIPIEDGDVFGMDAGSVHVQVWRRWWE